MTTTTTKNKLEFERAIIDVATIDKPGVQPATYSLKPVAGWKLADTGLGFWQAPNEGFYRPTHLPSGQALGPYVMRLANCKTYLRKLAELPVNWGELTTENVEEGLDNLDTDGIPLIEKARTLGRKYQD